MCPAALRNAEAALQQMPRHLDMLFFKANCVHSMMGETGWAGCKLSGCAGCADCKKRMKRSRKQLLLVLTNCTQQACCTAALHMLYCSLLQGCVTDNRPLRRCMF